MLKIQSFEFNLFGVHTYLVWDTLTHQCAVIDPGMASEREEKILDKFIEDNGLLVTHLINTHLHIDHTLGDDYVRTRYNLPLMANEADEFLGRQREGQARMFNLRIPTLAPLEIQKPLTQGDRVMLGDEYLEVFQVPGHSPGSIVLYSPRDHFLISGDVLFRGSVGRTDLPGGSFPTLMGAINSKLMTLPDDTVVYPGHGEPTTIGLERRSNPMITSR